MVNCCELPLTAVFLCQFLPPTCLNQWSLFSLKMRSRSSSFASSSLDLTMTTSSVLILQICLIMALSLRCRFILVSGQVSLAWRIRQSRAVGNMSWNRCESDCRSRGGEVDPGPVPYFHGDWLWNDFYCHSPRFRWIIQEGLLSVTSESMCMKYWLTSCSSLPRKNVWLGELTVPPWL